MYVVIMSKEDMMLLYGDVHVHLDGGDQCSHAVKHADKWIVTWKTMHDTANTCSYMEYPTMEEALTLALEKVGPCGYIWLNGKLYTTDDTHKDGCDV